MLVAEVLPHGSILFNACQYNIYVCHCTIIMIIIVVVAMITITVASSIVIVVTTGQTVEMHGNINQLVCPSCGVVVMMTPALLRKLKSKKPVPCTKCNCGAIRCQSVMAGTRLLLLVASGSAVLLILGRFAGRAEPSAKAVLPCLLLLPFLPTPSGSAICMCTKLPGHA